MAKAPADLRSLARAQTEMCVNVLTGIARSPKAAPSARATAAGILLDRGWGKAPQEHTGPDGGDIKVTIRQIIETTGEIPVKPEEDDEGSDK